MARAAAWGLGAVLLFAACAQAEEPGRPGGGGGGSGGATPAGTGGSVAPGGGGAGGTTSAGGTPARTGGASGTGGTMPAGTGGATPAGTGGSPLPTDDLPAAGNPDGHCTPTAEAAAESTANPRTVVGTGTKESCTGDAFVAAVAKGGVITFDCGPDAVTITLARTAKVVNDTGPKIVIDGGGKVTLSGGGKVRVLYQNTCDQAQKFTTDHCQDQDHPQLTVQNLTFVDGNSKGQTMEGGGGGAIFVRGGRLKIVNSRFFRNVCEDVGPDVGGAAVRVLSQWEGRPVHVVGSTFGGREGLGNVCSNGGGLSSIGVSYTVVNSLLSFNRAIGNGANPAQAGTPGGGSGGAIYNDGNLFTLSLCGTRITDNQANEGGGAIFFVSNNRTGSLLIGDSLLARNPSKKFETPGYKGIFFLGKGTPQVTNSTLE
jgi:hypothetical protein